MSRVSDDDLRAVFQLRAAGRPRPGLRRRIRRATGPASAERVEAAVPWAAPRRTVLVRIGALGGVMAILAMALAGALSDVRQRMDAQMERTADVAQVAVAADDRDGDEADAEVDEVDAGHDGDAEDDAGDAEDDRDDEDDAGDDGDDEDDDDEHEQVE